VVFDGSTVVLERELSMLDNLGWIIYLCGNRVREEQGTNKKISEGIGMQFDLKALREKKQKNREERLAFLEMYVEWLKRTPNKVWSKQHAEFIDAIYQRDAKKE